MFVLPSKETGKVQILFWRQIFISLQAFYMLQLCVCDSVSVCVCVLAKITQRHS